LVPPRADVRAAASPVRCPFCHTDVAPQAADWVACSACLARHHSGCWKESGACASCRAKESLEPNALRHKRAKRILAAGFAFSLVFVGLIALVQLNELRRQQATSMKP